MYAGWFERVVSGDKKGVFVSLALTVLTLLCALYFVVHSLRVLAYKLHLRRVRNLPRKVVSVGNITLGGTGKTPFIEFLARLLRKRKFRPVVLSRGYGSVNSAPSDEAMVLEENLPKVPHYSNPCRYRAGIEAIEKDNPDVFLLDDGFQHWQLARDLDIVLVDALNPFGYGRLFPRGMLREPLRALRRADVFVVTHSNQVTKEIIERLREFLQRLNPDALPVLTYHDVRGLRNARTEKRFDTDFLKDKKVLGFCGIGNPRAFHGILMHLKAQVADFHVFRDHFRYGPQIVELMVRQAKLLACEALVTTQKDAVKLREFKTELPILEVLIEMQISEGGQALEEKLCEVLEAE